MSGRSAIHAALVAGSLVIAGALASLASTFRPDGILGALQEALSFLFVIPYVLGIAVGASAHSPSRVGAFLGLFAEICVSGLLIWWIARRWRQRAQSPHQSSQQYTLLGLLRDERSQERR